MNSISTMQYEIDLLDHIQIRLNRIHSSLFALQSNTDTIYEYLQILASQILNPMVIPPEIMHSLLQDIHLCMFDQAMYALFTNNLPQIRKICRMKLKPRNADLAYSLDGYLWAIRSLTTTKIQIRCLRNNTVVEIKPPLQIVDLGNGCEGYTPNLYIPAQTELTATMMLPTRALFFFTSISDMTTFPNS